MSEAERIEKLREHLRVRVEDLVGDLLYYDRKEDEELSRDDVDELIDEGHVSKEEIMDWFEEALDEALDEEEDGG